MAQGIGVRRTQHTVDTLLVLQASTTETGNERGRRKSGQRIPPGRFRTNDHSRTNTKRCAKAKLGSMLLVTTLKFARAKREQVVE